MSQVESSPMPIRKNPSNEEEYDNIHEEKISDERGGGRKAMSAEAVKKDERKGKKILIRVVSSLLMVSVLMTGRMNLSICKLKISSVSDEFLCGMRFIGPYLCLSSCCLH